MQRGCSGIENSRLKADRFPSLVGAYCVILIRLGGAVFPLQTVILKRELYFSEALLVAVLFAEYCGIIAGVFLDTEGLDDTHSGSSQGVLLFCVGNLLTALASTALILLFARALVGIGRAKTEKTALLYAVGTDASRLVPGLAWHNAITAVSTVLSPLFAAFLLAVRGARAISFLMAAFGGILLLLFAFFPSKREKKRAVLKDACLGARNFFAVYGSASLPFLLFRGAWELSVVGVGISVLAMSENLLISGLSMSLLQLSVWLCRAAIFF